MSRAAKTQWHFLAFFLLVGLAVTLRADAGEPQAKSEDGPGSVAQVEKARVEVDAIAKRLRDKLADPLKRLREKDADLAKELDAAVRRNQTQIQAVIQDERKAVQKAYLWRQKYNADLERAMSSLEFELATAMEMERYASEALKQAWKAVEMLVVVKAKYPEAVAKPSEKGQACLDGIDQSAADIFAALDMLAKIRREEEKQRRTEGHVLAVYAESYIDVSLGAKDGLCRGEEVTLFRKSGDEIVETGAALVQVAFQDHAFARLFSTALARKVQPDDIVRFKSRVPNLGKTEMRRKTVGRVTATTPYGIVTITLNTGCSCSLGSDVLLVRGSGEAEVEIGTAIVLADREEGVLLKVTKTAKQREVQVDDRGCVFVGGVPTPFAQEFVLAWERAGATFTWSGRIESGFPEFGGTANTAANVLPACRIGKWKEGTVSKLPDPGTPFVLDLSWSGITDAELKALTDLKSLHSLDVEHTEVTDVGMKELAGMENLWSLNLESTEVTGAGLKELAGLRHLQSLDLCDTEVHGAGLAELAGLKNLRSLRLRSGKLADDGLTALAALENLQSLRVNGRQVTDATLEKLVVLKGLQSLDMSDTQVTGEGLEELVGLKHLKSLGLSNTRVTDEGLEHLARLKSLQSLRLSQTWVTDEGLMKLAGLKGLRWLDLYGTQVTLAGVDGLQESLPGCEITTTWSGSDAQVQRAQVEVDATVERVRDAAVPTLNRLAKKDIRLARELSDAVSRNRFAVGTAIEDEREAVSAAGRRLHERQGELEARYATSDLEYRDLMGSRRDVIERLHKTRGLLTELTGRRKADSGTAAEPDEDLQVLLAEIESASKNIDASVAELAAILEYERVQRSKTVGQILKVDASGRIEMALAAEHYWRFGDVALLYRRSGDKWTTIGTAFVRFVREDGCQAEIATTILGREAKVDDLALIPLKYRIRDDDQARRLFVGRVVAVNPGGRIEITLGSKEGLLNGQRVRLFRLSRKMTDGVGIARATKVFDHRAEASVEMTAEDREVQVGDRVRMIIERTDDSLRSAEGRVSAKSKSGLIEITIGSDDGLLLRDKLLVFRWSGDDAIEVGTASVEKVVSDRAVASIEKTMEEREVQMGDRVRLLIPEKERE